MNCRIRVTTLFLLLVLPGFFCRESQSQTGNSQGSKDSKDSKEIEFAQHVEKLKKRIPKGIFTIIIQKPFVVIGDEAPQKVKSRSIHTIKWAVDRLKEKYFNKDPEDIIDIWLFKDETSYRKYTRVLFNDNPDTPFGYYSPAHKALIMNIATGGGTLVHEIVHPFVAANFPECPAWFNEGLGSLYEQCGEKNNQIWGYTNWRLSGLQDAIKVNQVQSFKVLTATSDNEFYDNETDDYYAQSRYLCYYMQNNGLLKKFYNEFTNNYKNDPTGYETLKKVLNESDLDNFKKKWERFVLGLTFE